MLHTDTAAQSELERFRASADSAQGKSLILTLETHDLPSFTRRLMQIENRRFERLELFREVSETLSQSV